MRNGHLDPHESISVLGFLKMFNMMRYWNSIQERVIMWILPNLVKEQVGSTITSKICPFSQSKRNGDGTLTSYPAIVNDQLKTYERDEIFAEAEETVRRYAYQSNQSALNYSEALWTKLPPNGHLNKRGKSEGYLHRRTTTVALPLSSFPLGFS